MPKRAKNEEVEIEEYEVESIASHRVIGKTKRIEYHIKWKGYDSSDNTWEPESAVHAEELVTEYWSKHGGIEARDKLKGISGKTAKSSRKTNVKAESTSSAKNSKTSEKATTASPKRRKLTDATSSIAAEKKEEAEKKKEAEKKQTPIVKSEGESKDDDSEDEEENEDEQEEPKISEKEVEVGDEDNEEEEEEEEEDIDPDDIIRDKDYRMTSDWKADVETIIEVQNVENQEKGYLALVKWKDGKYSLHPTEVIRSKCPQQLIDYYESKLVFEKK